MLNNLCKHLICCKGAFWYFEDWNVIFFYLWKLNFFSLVWIIINQEDFRNIFLSSVNRLKWIPLVSAGYLCSFCLCRLHAGHLLSDFCSFALALLRGQHLRVVQLHMAHGWVAVPRCWPFLSPFAGVGGGFIPTTRLTCFCRERHLHIHRVLVGSARLLGGFAPAQGPQNLSRQPVTPLRCTLVCWSDALQSVLTL